MIVNIISGELQGLLNILIFKFRILGFQLITIGIQCNGLNDPAHSNPHAPDTGLPIHDFWINGNTVVFMPHTTHLAETLF